MQTYGHYEFEELMKDPINQSCFDCGKNPAHWASVNNANYLCLNCAGEHRGYGVAISYVRSITIDSWNDNQINMMRFGGNRNLKELLDVYAIDIKKVDKCVLYNSRLLDFYRKHLKAQINKDNFNREPPAKDEALKGLGGDTYNPNNINSSKSFKPSLSDSKSDSADKFKSISSDDVDNDKGFVYGLNDWMSKAVNSTKYLANKVGVAEIGSKIMDTGNVVAETGSNIVNKGTEAAVKLFFIYWSIEK